MRLNEIITEQQLDERPMGFLGKLGAKAKSFVPGRTGRRAKGELKVGDMANKLSDEFDEYLGQVDQGQGATPEIVIGFLKKKGYPTKGAEAAMKDPTMGQKLGKAAGTVAKGVGKAATAAADAAKNIAAGAKAGAKPKPEPIPTQTDQAKPKVGNTDLAASVDRSHMRTIAEGFTGGQLDKIFMAAAKDMVMQNTGGINQTGSGSVDEPAQGGAGGFMSGFKQGLKGDNTAAQDGEGAVIPKDIDEQLAKLNQQQKKELLRML